MCLTSLSEVRATKPASAPRAMLMGDSGRSTEPKGVDGLTVPTPRGGRVLALGQAVDAVVEQDDLEVHVAADGVHEVVAADARARRRRR